VTKLTPVLDNALDGTGTLTLNTSPILIEIVKPFKADLELSVDSITVKPEHALAIRQLLLENPPSTNTSAAEMGRLLADLGLSGITMVLEARFITLLGLPISDAFRPVRLTLDIKDLQTDLRLQVPELLRLGVELGSLDIAITDLVVDIPSTVVLDKFIASLGLTQQEYLLSLPVKGWLAGTVSNVLNATVDSLGLGLIIHLPDMRLNIGSLLEGSGGLPAGLPQGLNDMTLGLELERIAGDAQHLGIDIGMSAWVEAQSPLRDYDQVLSIPAKTTATQTLQLQPDSSLGIAVSGDGINRLLAALTDADFTLNLKLSDLLPGLGLPKDTQAGITLGAPPYMEIQNGAIKMVIPNLRVSLFMNAAEQLDITIDMIMDIKTRISLRDGSPYLGIDLAMENFRVGYLADRMGIENAIDIEKTVQKLLPQIMSAIQPTLDTLPLELSKSDLDGILDLLGINTSNDDSLPQVIDNLPEFTFSLTGLTAQDGYLGVFVNLKQ
jgi:hypothetical protein